MLLDPQSSPKAQTCQDKSGSQAGRVWWPWKTFSVSCCAVFGGGGHHDLTP